MVERKIKLTRRFSFIRLLNEWRGGIFSATSGRFDLVWGCCWVTLLPWPGIQRPVWPLLALLICSLLQTPAPENTICGKKNDWLKNRPFFITENFLGILDRLCAEPMSRSHDFLSLTLAVVGSTCSCCYFLLQCRCLSVCVLCILVVRCVKSWVGESE